SPATRTEKSPSRIACKACSRSYSNDVAPSQLVLEPCSRPASREPVAGDSIVSHIHCTLFPPAMIKAHAPGRKNTGDHIFRTCTALVFFPHLRARRCAPPALIQKKTRKIGKSSKAPTEFSLIHQTVSHFVRVWAGFGKQDLDLPAVKWHWPRLLEAFSLKKTAHNAGTQLLVFRH